MTSVPDVPRLDQCETIARLIHVTATAAHQQHPNLLTEAGLAWLQSSPTEAQPTQIAAQLANHRDATRLLQAVDHLLSQIFAPAFQATKAHGQVRQRVQQIVAPVPPPSSNPSPNPSPNPSSNSSPNQPTPSGDVDLPPDSPPQGDQSTETEETPTLDQGAPQIPHPLEDPPVIPSPPSTTPVDPQAPWSGLLLVDAENMHPSATLEAHLQSLAQYPLRYRLAFGNWRTLGNRDQEFYRRGYQMIHVPSGKNSADIKMSLDASLISLHHPSIREVFICSADSDLLHLGYVLLRQGLIPYRVSHDQQGFKVLNLAQQTTHTVALPPDATAQTRGGSKAKTAQPTADPDPTPHIPASLEQMKRWLRILILQEHQAHPDQPVTLGRLGTLFHERNHVSANQVLQTYAADTTLKQLLEADSTFVLTPLTEDGTSIQVALNLPPLDATTALVPAGPTPLVSPITDVQTLEKAVVAILPSLINEPRGTVSLSLLGSTFAQVYHQPMSHVLQRLGEPKGLPRFLAKCSAIRLERQGENWHVGLTLQGNGA
ncbi:MAG: NYN domain-containing protein [Spirulina sp.]